LSPFFLEERQIPEAGDEAATEEKSMEEQKNVSDEAGAEEDGLTSFAFSESLDLNEIRGKFDS
jgi:hypothetical protein